MEIIFFKGKEKQRSARENEARVFVITTGLVLQGLQEDKMDVAFCGEAGRKVRRDVDAKCVRLPLPSRRLLNT